MRIYLIRIIHLHQDGTLSRACGSFPSLGSEGVLASVQLSVLRLSAKT
jgi:hypothetical protein